MLLLAAAITNGSNSAVAQQTHDSHFIHGVFAESLGQTQPLPLTSRGSFHSVAHTQASAASQHDEYDQPFVRQFPDTVPPRESFHPQTGSASSTGGCGSCATSSCCGNLWCCDPSRDWTFRAGAIFLHRETPKYQPLISDPAIPASGLNASDFRPGWGTGLDLSLVRHRLFQSDSDFELRFFDVDNFSDSQALRLNGNPLVIHTNPATFITGGRDVSSQYSVGLLNAEANLRQRVAGNLTWLNGFRYLRLNERLNSQLINGPGVGDIVHSVAADNDLFGVQTGLVLDLVSTCDCCVQLYGKAGVFVNDAGQHTSLTNFSAPATTFAVNGDSAQLAGLGEFGVTASRRLSNHVAIRGGYQVMGLYGVATAPRQFASSSFLSGSGISNNDNVIFHGATLQLELTY